MTVPEGDRPLAVTRDGAVATLWLNRPEKRNAVTLEMWNGIASISTALAKDPTVRVLVVRGVGDHFSAGADITGLADVAQETYQRATRAAERALAAFPRPTVAFVTGSCVGGGAQLAIACDLRIADTTSRFGITPARLGLVYPAQAIERAVWLLGPAATKHLLFSAELIDADRALRIGLVDEVHDPEAAGERLDAFVRTLVDERSLLTQQASKEMIDAVAATGVVDAAIVDRWDSELAASADPAEGIDAFVERRPPDFTWTGDDR